MVHEYLEASRCIGKSHKYYQVLIKSHFGIECSFSFLSLCDSDEVVGSLQIEFGVSLSTINAVHDLIDMWQRVAVFDGDIIEFSVVDAKL